MTSNRFSALGFVVHQGEGGRREGEPGGRRQSLTFAGFLRITTGSQTDGKDGSHTTTKTDKDKELTDKKVKLVSGRPLPTLAAHPSLGDDLSTEKSLHQP